VTQRAPNRDKIAEDLRKGPPTLSHTQGEEFHRCPRRWAYHRIMGFEPDPDEDQESLVYGDCGHRALENTARGVAPGQAVQAAIADMQAKAKGAAWFPEASRKLSLHVQGFLTHYWPKFIATWDIVDVERKVEYTMSNGIIRRGVIDVIARHKQTRQLGIFDYKFAGDMYVRNLLESLKSSPQLAMYLMLLMRAVTSEVPTQVGYMFLKKPRPNENVGNLVHDPTKYTDGVATVDQAFMGYAAHLEANDTSLSSLMLHYRQSYATFGPSALAAVPANPGGCYMYGKCCGFAKGCHCGKPLHIALKEAT